MNGPEIDDFVIEREEATIDLPNPTPPTGQHAATEDAYQHIAYDEANSGLTAHTPSGSHASVDGLIIENTELSFDGATLSAPGLELWGPTATDELYPLDASAMTPAAPMQDVLAEIESLVAEVTTPAPPSAGAPLSEPPTLTPWVEEDLSPTPVAAATSVPEVVEVVAIRAVADEASAATSERTLDQLKVHEAWGSTPTGGVGIAPPADLSPGEQEVSTDEAAPTVVVPVAIAVAPSVVADAEPAHASPPARVEPAPEAAAEVPAVDVPSPELVEPGASSLDAQPLHETPIEVETLLESVLEAALEPRPALAPTVHLTPFSPTPPIGVHVVQPPALASSPTRPESTDDVRASEAIARALERIAERVRSGELAIERDAASLSDGAALAMALAALLDHSRS